MVKKPDGEIIANAMLKIAEALENVSNSIDELASKTEPTDMSEVAGSLDSIANSIGGTLDVRLDGDIGVSKND